MDVTPQELRDIDIREAWRGYHRDDVDELLERAASTIEHLEHQIRILQERLASGATVAPAAAPQPAPQPAPAPRPAPVPVPDSDVIQRTLILAQKAADEAVAEAQARAQHLIGESEAKAQALVSEAESTARRIAESERRRIEAEIAELSATRDALSGDVDALERFAVEYRDRIRRAIEAELSHLAETSRTGPAPLRPALQTDGLVLPSAAPVAALAASPEPSGPPTIAIPAVEAVPAVPAVEVVETAGAGEAVEVLGVGEPPRWDTGPEGEAQAWSPEPAGGWGEVGATTGYDDRDMASMFEAPVREEAAIDSLDDDAFFASLRDAVRDDEPLGPRDDGFYDEDDTDGGRRLFRRRR